jgi:hypothetical protein
MQHSGKVISSAYATADMLGKQGILLLLLPRCGGVGAMLQLQPKSARAITTMLQRLTHGYNVLMIARDKAAIMLQPLQEVREMWGPSRN